MAVVDVGRCRGGQRVDFVAGAGERPELILVLGGINELDSALNLQLGFRKVLEPEP